MRKMTELQKKQYAASLVMEAISDIEFFTIIERADPEISDSDASDVMDLILTAKIDVLWND